jgi:hypothetical protein
MRSGCLEPVSRATTSSKTVSPTATGTLPRQKLVDVPDEMHIYEKPAKVKPYKQTRVSTSLPPHAMSLHDNTKETNASSKHDESDADFNRVEKARRCRQEQPHHMRKSQSATTVRSSELSFMNDDAASSSLLSSSPFDIKAHHALQRTIGAFSLATQTSSSSSRDVPDHLIRLKPIHITDGSCTRREQRQFPEIVDAAARPVDHHQQPQQPQQQSPPSPPSLQPPPSLQHAKPSLWLPLHGLYRPYSLVEVKSFLEKDNKQRPYLQVSFRVCGKFREIQSALVVYHHTCGLGTMATTTVHAHDLPRGTEIVAAASSSPSSSGLNPVEDPRTTFSIYKDGDVSMALRHLNHPRDKDNDDGLTMGQDRSMSRAQHETLEHQSQNRSVSSVSQTIRRTSEDHPELASQRFACIGIKKGSEYDEGLHVDVYHCFPTPQSAIR